MHPDNVWKSKKQNDFNHCRQYGDKSVRRVYRTMEEYLITEYDGRIKIVRSITKSGNYLPKKLNCLPEIVVSNTVSAEGLGAALRKAYVLC